MQPDPTKETTAPPPERPPQNYATKSEVIIPQIDDVVNGQDGRALLEHLHRGGRHAYRWTSHNRQSLWYEVGAPSRNTPPNIDLYFGVHPCYAIPPTNFLGEVKEPPFVRSQNDYIAAVNALYAEYDDKDFGSAAERRAHVDDLAPAPSARVESGGGEHCYWLLATPHILTNSSARVEAARIQAGWVQLMGGDPGAKDLARVLRIPGSNNHKYSPSRPVTMAKFDRDLLYTFQQLAELVPAPSPTPHQETPLRTSPRSTNGKNPRYVAAAIEDELSTLARTPEGNRNAQLYRSAQALGSFVGAGAFSRTEAEQALTATALAIGLPEREAQATIKSGIASGEKHDRHIPEPTRREDVQPLDVGGKPATDKAQDTTPLADTFGANDLGTAQATLARYPNRFIHTDTHGWLLYNGDGYWSTEKATSAAERAIVNTLNWRITEALKRDAEASASLVKFCAPNAYRIRGGKQLLAMMTAETVRDFDANPDLLNCPNGAVDLRTGELLPHDPGHLFMHVTGVSYDPAADASFWTGWLTEVTGDDADLVDWLQMAVGYSLTGHTNEEIVFYLHGPTRAGKGVFTEALQSIMGRQLSKEISFTVLTSKRHADDQNFALAPLKSARIVMASESNVYERFDEAKLKRISGGNEIHCAFKHKNFFSYRPQFKVWLSSNHPIKADPEDDAAWGRLRVVPFPNSYLGREKKNLKEQMRMPEIRQGILAWAVEGARRWYEAIETGRGLPELPRLAEAKQSQRADLDHVQQWINERTEETNASQWTTYSELYTDYKDWCKDNGIIHKHGPRFSESLKKKGYKQRKIKVSRFYGIELLR